MNKEKIRMMLNTRYDVKIDLEQPKNWQERYNIYKSMLVYASGLYNGLKEMGYYFDFDIYHIVTDKYNQIEKTYNK